MPKRTPILGKYDAEIRSVCEQLRTAGTAVNKRVLGAVITSVLLKHDPSLLKSNGGAIDPYSRGLIGSCYRRYGWVI